MKKQASFRWERAFRGAGYGLIAGVDEVGRGALAGPLVSAAVIFDSSTFERRSSSDLVRNTVRDSKLLSREGRALALSVIGRTASSIGVGVVESHELDILGMTAANRIAMERAVFDLGERPDALVLDALVTDLDLPQVGLIDGDALCLSIAAASIVAKVTRDRIMLSLHEVDCRYGFDQHVGYGTKAHLCALREHGPAVFHRRSFRPVQECLNRA